MRQRVALPRPRTRLNVQTQGLLLLAFGSVYLASTIGILIFSNHRYQAGPVWFWVTGGLTLIILGATLFVPVKGRGAASVRTVLRAFARAWAGVVQPVRIVPVETPKHVTPTVAGKDHTSWVYRFSREESLSTEHVPLYDTIRIALISVAVITLTAWFTVYSGGPFASPFGQFLLALPLLAPNVATTGGSIFSVSLLTLITAGLTQWAFDSGIYRVLGYADAITPSPLGLVWFLGTTVGIVLLSAILAITTKTMLELAQAGRVYLPWYVTLDQDDEVVVRAVQLPSQQVGILEIAIGAHDSTTEVRLVSCDGKPRTEVRPLARSVPGYTVESMSRNHRTDAILQEDKFEFVVRLSGVASSTAAIKIDIADLVKGRVRLDGLVFDPGSREARADPDRWTVSEAEYHAIVRKLAEA